MSNSNATIYIKAKKHTILRRPQVTIGDIASIVCTDPALHESIKKLPLYTFPDKTGKDISNIHTRKSTDTNINKNIKTEFRRNDDKAVDSSKTVSRNSSARSAQTQPDAQMEFFTMLRVISLIQEKYPQVQVESIGEQDFIVEYQTKTPAPAWMNHCKVAILCIVIFFGSAFTIMAFNNDISVTEIFTRFYEQLMGQEKPAVSELEIAYSIGLAVGILVFFNHFGRRKFSIDPTPIQVEVNKFSSDCEDTLIENADQRGHEEDAS